MNIDFIDDFKYVRKLSYAYDMIENRGSKYEDKYIDGR